MLYDSILARSFSKQEQKKFRCRALIGCFLIALSFFTVLKPYLGPLPPINLRVSMGAGLKMLTIKDTSSFKKIKLKENSISQHLLVNNTFKDNDMYCSITRRSEFCEINSGGVRIEASSGTVFISMSSSRASEDNSSWIIRPYARLADEIAMSRVAKWYVKSVKSHQELPECTQNHSIPAILFSNGGYAGNHFHDFTDIIIPLYLTSRQFNGEVQFLVTDKKFFWIEKFRKILQNLSNYDIIDIDQESDKVHCFPRGIIGLKAYEEKELTIDPTKSSYTMNDFRQFLRSCYNLQKSTAITIKEGENHQRPRLLIVSRKKTRTFTNVGELVAMAEELGYEVVVTEADENLSRFVEIVNSCDVFLGVHGAGLTNIMFLPDDAVFIQVVPVAVEGVARDDFEEPSKDMKLKYLGYKIKAEESTLIQEYPNDHPIFRDSDSIGKLGWRSFKSLYLDKQNVQLDLSIFRDTLLKALELLHQ